MEGWREARALAPKGGALEFLGPVNNRLRELDKMPNTSARYAEVAIRAAVSAAQEERDEMQLFLEHARDLSRQMELAGAAAEWPLPIDRSEEHTSELQSQSNLVCRLLLEKKKTPGLRRLGLADVTVLCLLGGVIATVISFAREFEAPLSQEVRIDLSPTALPRYTLYSLSL